MADQERSWADLPPLILCMIRARLFPKDYDVFGAVCASWRSIAPLSPRSPFLITYKDNNVVWRFYHPGYNATSYMDLSICLDNRQICASNFGWLLLYEYQEGWVWLDFLNPFTSEIIQVPALQHPGFDMFYFASPPTSSDCTVIALRHEGCFGPLGTRTNVGIIKRGEKDWKVTRFEHIDHLFTPSICNPVFFDGRYYIIGDEGKIGVFDVKSNRWNFCGLQLVQRHKRFLHRPIAMVEDGGGILLVVYESSEHQQVRVVRVDLSKMTCKEVGSLGPDKTMYVSRGLSYLETKVAPDGMGNRIYFPRFHNGYGVYYSLATNKYHSVDGSYSCSGPYGLSEPRLCTWFKPISLKACSAEEIEWVTT